MMDSKVAGFSFEWEKYELWFSVFWFFVFSFALFLLYRWVYKWGNKIFRREEIKVIGFTMGIVLVVALGLIRLYPVLNKLVIGKIYNNVSGSHPYAERSVLITKATSKTLDVPPDSVVYHDKVRVGVNAVFSTDSYPSPLLIEHIFVLLTIMLTMLLLHLLDKKQEMKLEYEKIKIEKLQNSYNALMGQINPHFFFNSLNGLNSLIRIGERERTLEYLDGLSNVFRYILQSNHKTLVPLDEELQFIKAYTYLLGVRYENKLFFSIQVDEICLQMRLPILSLLPLIENAVKPNIISMQHPLRSEIYTTSENLLVVSNHIQPKMEERVCNGIGLKNLQGRYEMLVGRNIQIDDSNGVFTVSLPLLNVLK